MIPPPDRPTIPAVEDETTTTKTTAEIDSEHADGMTDMDVVTTPKNFEEDLDGEGRSMLEESSTTLSGDEDITTPKSESESTVSSVSQEGSTEASDMEVTALPIDADEDVEMTTLSQSPPSLGPSSEEPEGSGSPDTGVTSGPDTPSVPEDGTVTTIMPDAVVTLLTTVRPTTQEEAQTEQPKDGEDTTNSSSAGDKKSPESESEEEEEPEDGGMHEFDCSEFTDAELAFADPNQIPLECRLRPKEGGEPKTVYILIPKEGLDLTRLFDKNVKVVVKDLMIMDISPK